jgi:K+-transporting ATPase KdpF subunit
MTLLYVIGGIVAFALLVYLFVALLAPEKFE